MNIVDLEVKINGTPVKLEDRNDLNRFIYQLIRLVRWPEVGPFRIITEQPRQLLPNKPPEPVRTPPPKRQVDPGRSARSARASKKSTAEYAAEALADSTEGLNLPLLIMKMQRLGWVTDAKSKRRAVFMAMTNKPERFRSNGGGRWHLIEASGAGSNPVS